MIENVYEQCVFKEDRSASAKYSILTFIAVAIMVAGGVTVGIVFSAFNWELLIIGIPLLVLGVYLWHKRDEFYLEYEYDFSVGKLEIVKIINNKKRKTLGLVEVADIEAMGKVSTPSYNRFKTMPDIKKNYACYNKNDPELYYIYYQNAKQKRILVHFLPDEEMMVYIRKCIKVRIETK